MTGLIRLCGEDLRTIVERDPSVHSRAEALLHPALPALWGHRIAHRLHRRGRRVLARFLMTLMRAVTGVEIHPGAVLGRRVFIDHGSGVVIGETAEIGENVTIYQGVTLGGTGFASGKRHPTVEANVTIGSGAKLLGPIVVGHGAKIGANAVVIHDVPANSTVVGNPGHPVRVEGRRPEGPDADWVHLPDPIADALKGLSARITDLEGRVPREEGDSAPGEVLPLRPRRGPNPAGG
jgi:serine O-acetyltransferase